MEDRKLTIRPTIRHWVAKWLPLWAVAGVLSWLVGGKLPQMLGAMWDTAGSVIFWGFVALGVVTIYDAVKILLYTEWTVDSQQITIREGVFRREENYTELYRIIDFRVNQSVLQLILGISTITLYSSDKSNPQLRIFGVSGAKAIVAELRERVEFQRQEKGIREFTNTSYHGEYNGQ